MLRNQPSWGGSSSLDAGAPNIFRAAARVLARRSLSSFGISLIPNDANADLSLASYWLLPSGFFQTRFYWQLGTTVPDVSAKAQRSAAAASATIDGSHEGTRVESLSQLPVALSAHVQDELPPTWSARFRQQATVGGSHAKLPPAELGAHVHVTTADEHVPPSTSSDEHDVTVTPSQPASGRIVQVHPDADLQHDVHSVAG
jgi:hypothetical protein